MTLNIHREEVTLMLLANTDIALDPESIAATYDTPVDEWHETFERLEEKGYIERIEPGVDVYRLTGEGRSKATAITRGSGNSPRRTRTNRLLRSLL